MSEEKSENENDILSKEQYNNYIKIIEPNLNKILFSDKVILVEWPNDILVYKYIIQKKVLDKFKEVNPWFDDEEYIKRYTESYLNFHNIAIIPHHGKWTAYCIAKLCNHLKVDYYMINDRDFDEDFIDKIDKDFDILYKIEKIKNQTNAKWHIYEEKIIKWMITANKMLFENAFEWQIHFNIPKLEAVIWYNSDNKNSSKIYKKLLETDNFLNDIFPDSLNIFLKIDQISIISVVAS